MVSALRRDKRVCVVAVSSTFDMMEEGWRRVMEREKNMVRGERESQN